MATVVASGEVGLIEGRLSGVGWQCTERAAARKHTSAAVLSPTLALEPVGSRTKILFELVAVLVVVADAMVRKTTLTPGLSGVLVLRRTKLPGSLGLLLERLLLLSVGVANLDLELLAGGVLDAEVVKSLDDLLADITALEAVRRSVAEYERVGGNTHRANPTPRPCPLF